MKCNTRDFGEIEYTKNDIITFSQAPFGFEEYTEYILLHDDSVSDSFVWLQSVTESSLCFVMLEAKFFADVYSPNISDGTVFVICTIGSDFAKSTVNLKSPVVIDEVNKVGKQIILAENYSVRHNILAKSE